MEIKYFMGYHQVTAPEYNAAQMKAEAEGNIVAEVSDVNGHKEYTLENGIVIRGDNKGGFNRIENGEVKEPWQVGTANETVEEETIGAGKADFFFRE